MSVTPHWNELCEQLCPGDSTLLKEVELSISDPAAYFENFSDVLVERGIEDPSEVDSWLALVDGLARRGYLREEDWKLEAEEIAFQLERLCPCKERKVQFVSLRNTEKIGEALLELAAFELKKYDLSLLYLEIDGDCYPLVVVSSEKAPQVVKLAQLLKQNASMFPR